MTSQTHTPERAFAEAVLENGAIGENSTSDDAKALRAARASVRIERWRRREAAVVADEAGERGGRRLEIILKRRRTE